MLQFLQYKTFGNHKIPDGWIIVVAGNPPEYNKSVREFAIATLTAYQKIDVEADFEVWKEYAKRRIFIRRSCRSSPQSRSFYQVGNPPWTEKCSDLVDGEDSPDFESPARRWGLTCDRGGCGTVYRAPADRERFANHLELYKSLSGEMIRSTRSWKGKRDEHLMGTGGERAV